MDFATLIGLAVSFALLAEALSLGGDLSIFVNGPAALIVLGGTFGATLTNYPPGVLLRASLNIGRSVLRRAPSTSLVIGQFMNFAYLARREGVLTLENQIRLLDDAYLCKGLQLTVDGLEPEYIRSILEMEIDSTHARNSIGVDLLNVMASYAPALGMIGTVIGLMQMLRTLSDPSSIGPAMAVALITTFYGAILSNLVFLPLCGKLKHISQEEIRVMEMRLEGIICLAKGENPRVIRDLLEGFQSPEERRKNPDISPFDLGKNENG
ncbi:MAG: motility protein A [Deltaproteobacteria bacterium]|jgi:chemotaxis protein MotA|nr:motility protein A [Deltaproteobacteria bacterium]